MSRMEKTSLSRKRKKKMMSEGIVKTIVNEWKRIDYNFITYTGACENDQQYPYNSMGMAFVIMPSPPTAIGFFRFFAKNF